jgi:hypothetical protein
MAPDSPTTTNYERAFDERPDVYSAWGRLLGAIKANMDLRRYELAMLAAARRLRSTYCSLAHGKVLIEEFGEPVLQIATDRTAAARSFWTKTLDALGVQADASYRELDPELREVLVVGRPIADE